MNRDEYITQLTTQASEDFGAAEALKAARYYGHALFWAHLVLEKMCKALWVHTNKNTEHPYIHNLLRLLKESKADITKEQAEFYAAMNQFQAISRYADELEKKEATINLETCNTYFEKVNREVKWLQGLMQ